MKALLLSEYKSLQVTEMPTPELGPHDVLIRVRACGICGSDIHGYDGSSGRRIPPLVMGHEAAGEVAAVGADVQRFELGDLVTMDSMVSCGRCRFCLRGETNLCDNRRVLGVSCGDYRQHGAFAEFVAVPERIVYSLPAGLAVEHAALVEPVSIALHAVSLTPIRLGDVAVVVGTGMIGLLIVQALRWAGCGRIYAVDLDDEKLQLACRLGAHAGLNPSQCDVPAEIRKLTEGTGADVALEAVGATAPVECAINSVRKGGAVTLVGNLAPKIDFPLQSVVTRQIRLIGSCASKGNYLTCLQMMADGKIDVAPLISAVAPLEQGAAWFERLYAGEKGLLKVVLQP
ncbi:MAG: galactitol-1-phosphate 5-dehydrogenase [Planctomycetales bacterium]|nr:galactitol-1-phosphate 5-dehydrogenase [Planctomycetales bacterium]